MIIRKKESYDGAQPSGNALICSSLHYLGHVFDLSNWTLHAEKMIHSMRPALLQYPSSFGCWAQSFYQMSTGMTELVGVGPTVHESLPAFNAVFLPNTIRITSQVQDDRIPLLKDKKCDDNQYFILLSETIMGNNGQELTTPARVGRNTGIIQVSKQAFTKMTVPMRMAILLHEFSHFYLNEKIDDEMEADLNGLLIYLSLGYPRIEAYQAFLETFKERPSHLNKARYDLINKFINDFEKMNMVIK